MGAPAAPQVTVDQIVARRNAVGQVVEQAVTLRDESQSVAGWTVTDQSGLHLPVLRGWSADSVSLPLAGPHPPAASPHGQ